MLTKWRWSAPAEKLVMKTKQFFSRFLDKEELCPAKYFIDFMLVNVIQNWKRKNFCKKCFYSDFHVSYHTIQRVKKFLVDLWNDTVHRVFQQGDRPWIFQAVIQVGDNFLVRTSPFFVTKVSFIKLKVFLENILDK